ncbi:TetR/AcrR family transcriptional regulator [Amycolatopsis samaneae]|uniref:TetR/AcrR family transcriptional regulator n=1 Tax=Amycolatopsis samaneae TaxID=664691 RepID=A0ABW5G859_9PSEU
MSEEVGLRELKKQRTRQAISEAAIRMFLENGFDDVSVVEVAAAAEVSKRTLFKYFPSKEDLVVHRFADHKDELARYVRDREPGEAPLDALERGWLDALRRHDEATGLCDRPGVKAFFRLVLDTAGLTARLKQHYTHAERLLADALEETGYPRRTARLAACQITAVQGLLVSDTAQEVASGRSAEEVHPEAATALREALALLRDGLRPPTEIAAT